jgi:hypothetical protein
VGLDKNLRIPGRRAGARQHGPVDISEVNSLGAWKSLISNIPDATKTNVGGRTVGSVGCSRRHPVSIAVRPVAQI